MDNAARAAEIEQLRGRIAAGFRDADRVHLRLARLFVESGQRDKAVATYRLASMVFWESGFILKAFAALNRARELDSSNRDVQREFEERLREIPAGLCTTVGLQPPSGQPNVVSLRLQVEEMHRERIRRCTLRYENDPPTVIVAFSLTKPVPRAWLEKASYAVEVAGVCDLIPCDVRVLESQRCYHQLELTPTTGWARAALQRNVRTSVVPDRSLSNMRAVSCDTGVGPPHRITNVYFLRMLAAPQG